MSRAEEFQAQSALRELEDLMARVRAGLEDMRAGKMVILADDEDRPAGPCGRWYPIRVGSAGAGRAHQMPR